MTYLDLGFQVQNERTILTTREEIDRIQFSTTRLKEGYVQDEVDDFLDRVGDGWGALEAQNRKLEDDNGHLREQVRKLATMDTAQFPAVQPPPATAERVLQLADETAQRHISEAVSEAGRIHSDANAEAGQVKAAARAEAAGIVSVAEAERQKVLNELETARAELAEQIETLKAKRSNYKTWLRAALNNIEQEEIDA